MPGVNWLIIVIGVILVVWIFAERLEDWFYDWRDYWFKPKAEREWERKRRKIHRVVAKFWRQVGGHPLDWQQYLIDLLTRAGLYAEGKTIAIGAYLPGFLEIAVVGPKRGDGDGDGDGDEEVSLLILVVSTKNEELPPSTYPVLRQIAAKGMGSLNDIGQGAYRPNSFCSRA